MLIRRPTTERAAVARRIKSWAVARFGAGDEAWLVSEAVCGTPGQPPRQTIVALVHPAAQIAFRFPCAMEEVTEAAVGALGDHAARLAAEACC